MKLRSSPVLHLAAVRSALDALRAAIVAERCERKWKPLPEEPTNDRIAYYRGRAAEARAKADLTSDHEARATALQVAQLWEFMAKTAETRPGPAH